MARPFANSLLNSLKGKIWLATSALAFFICTFGLISYLIVALFAGDLFYAVFVPFLFLAFMVMVFGWWLSNEVVSPIEKVSLLAKSLERGGVVSLPRTSGSIETDELLQTLHRHNQQTQNLVNLMDKVASGNLDVTLATLQNSDRLVGSFQKLLTKVSESIHAKRDLEKLEVDLKKITGEFSVVKNGKFNIEITSHSAQTKEVSEIINSLLRHLNNLVSKVKVQSTEAENSASEVQKSVRLTIQTNEIRISEMQQAKLTLADIPNNVKKLSEEISILPAVDSIEKARRGTQFAQANLKAIGEFRKQIQETVKRNGQFEKYSEEISKIGKSIEDIVNRTNIIALNASIKAIEAEEKNHGFSILAEELENLSGRAETIGGQILSFNKTFSAQIGETEQSLQAAISEAAKLSEFAVETGNSLSAMEKYIGNSLKLREKLAAYSGEQTNDTEQAFQIFVASIAESEKSTRTLRESEAYIERFLASMEILQAAAANFSESSNSSEITENSKHPIEIEIYATEPFVDFAD